MEPDREGQAESLLRPMMKRLCDWDDPSDVASVRAANRHLQRERRIPTDRRCPSCRAVIVSNRSWVVDASRALCRSCYSREERYKKGVPPEEAKPIAISVFPKVEYRYVVDGDALFRARRASGLSLHEFARRCGWSRSRQQTIESTAITLSAEAADIILAVLLDAGVKTKDATI